MLIYVDSITNRLRFTLDLMMRELVGIDFELTTDPDRFSFYTGPKMNYSKQAFGNELFLYANDLLFEKKIKRQDIAIFEWNDTKAFFATHPKYVMPFDPFAAAFYLVSRYEEYLPFNPDKFSRFDAPESLAYQKGFLSRPIVNCYAKAIKKILKEHFSSLQLRERKYTFQTTIDIDNAWAFRQKGIVRTCGAILRSISTFDFNSIKERAQVLTGKKKDPYDTYDLLDELSKKYGLNPIYFFLVGDYAENDKNVSISKRKFQTLIKSIADYHEVGLHPSYASNKEPERLRLEQSRLSQIINREITKSRQHFLKLSFPFTYRNLLETDITDDYTMGFSAEIGFRAGICSPFYFYDLEREMQTKLRIHPFAVMDATLKYYMKIQPPEVMSFVGPLIKEVKAVNGTFTILWHNESLSNLKPWEGWKDVYEEIIKAAH